MSLLLPDFEQAVAFMGRSGCYSTPIWRISWRLGEFRLDDHIEPEVLRVNTIDVSEEIRCQGHVKALIEELIATGTVGGRDFQWLAFTDCCDNLIAILRHLGFTVVDPTFRRICYRQARQMRFPF